MRREGRGDLAAGVAALVLLGVGVYLAFGSGLPWDRDPEIRALVASATGLQPGSPVRIAGVDVGNVAGIDRGPGSTAELVLAISDDAPALRRDATVKIRPRTFLEGNFFVELRPGTPAAPRLGPGGTIPLSQTSVSVQLDEVLGALDRPTRDGLRDFVGAYSAALRAGGARALRRGARDWRDAFGSGAVVARAFRGERDGDLAGAVDGTGRMLAAIARDEGHLARLVVGFQRTMGAFADRRRQFAGSIVEFTSLLRAAPDDLTAVARLAPATRSFLIAGRPALRAAPRTLSLALPVLRDARWLVTPALLPTFLDRLDPSIRELGRLEPRLERLAGSARPVADCVRRNVVPTLTQAVDDPPHSTGRPVYQEFLSSLVGLTGASQNFDGNGPSVRYHAGLGEQLVTLGSLSGAQAPLAALAAEPVLGSRPAYPGQLPPLRADVPCATQTAPDLTAQTGPAPTQRRRAR